MSVGIDSRSVTQNLLAEHLDGVTGVLVVTDGIMRVVRPVHTVRRRRTARRGHRAVLVFLVHTPGTCEMSRGMGRLGMFRMPWHALTSNRSGRPSSWPDHSGMQVLLLRVHPGVCPRQLDGHV